MESVIRMTSALQLVDYIGHNLINFRYNNNQKGILSKGKKGIEGLNLSYDLADGIFADEKKVIVVSVSSSFFATDEGGNEVFKLDFQFQSLFKVSEISDISDTFYEENKWYFTKFIHRSGKRLVETLLSNTEYKYLHVPSFLPTHVAEK